MASIIGIDLGTTFSAAAIVRDGQPEILLHGDERIMPSVVGLSPQNQVLVGSPARNQYILYPERTARSIKRKMGQDERISLGELSYLPQEISALILIELKRSAEAQLGTDVDRVVITVPAYFSDAARQATRDAGEIAGFKVERIINEPTAAALAYGLDRATEHELVAVYDLGGGTFDVSIIELDSGVVEVRASHGNTELGGDDFDARLVDFLAERFMEANPAASNPRTDRKALARLTRAAEEAKIRLSSQPFTRVREEYLLTGSGGKPLHLDTEVSRSQFEELIADLLEGTLQSFDAALSDAGLSSQELDRILFVGGSTRIPLVWQMVHQHSGLEPETAINPDEAVSLGAAVQAAIIAGEPLDAILVDVTPHSLGIQVAEIEFGRINPDHYSILIQRNTTIPTTRSEVYSALYPEQTSINIKVYQGENPRASRNTLLGEFLFEDLKPEKPGQPPRVTVQFDFDVDGIMHVSAQDRGSGKQTRTTVKAARTRISPAEMESARTALAELEFADTTDLEDELEMDADFEEDDPSDYEDEEDDEDEEDQPIKVIMPPAPLKLETLGALSRARRLINAGQSDTADLKQTVAALEEAVAFNDESGTTSLTEQLIDQLYDFED